jgi:hypothetical protein
MLPGRVSNFYGTSSHLVAEGVGGIFEASFVFDMIIVMLHHSFIASQKLLYLRTFLEIYSPGLCARIA